MFQTNNSAEVHVPRPLALKNERLWSWLSLPIHIPIYFVSIRMKAESGAFDRMFFAGDLEQVKDLARYSASGRLIGVQLISPKWLNGENDWLMEPLREVLLGKCPEGRPIRIYVLDNGRRYTDTELGVPESSISDLETIFSVRSKSH